VVEQTEKVSKNRLRQYTSMAEENETIYIKGAINEEWDTSRLFQEEKSPLLLNMKEVERINSMGVRVWVETLRKLSDFQVIIEECPPIFVDQCNMISELLGNQQVRIHSFYANYYCQDDDHEEKVLLTEGTHYHWGEGIIQEPKPPCPVCSQPMELDDDPESYFQFLLNLNRR